MVEALEVALEWSAVFEIYLTFASGVVIYEVGGEFEFVYKINVKSFSLFLILLKVALILIISRC